MIRDQLKEIALAQVGKPYSLQGWGPHAFDCIGLSCYPGREAGIFKHYLADETDPVLRCYSNTPDPPTMLRGLRKYFVKIEKADLEAEAKIGDLLWFRCPKAQHLGVIIKAAAGDFWVVHADIRKMKVRVQGVRKTSYIICGWRYPELANGQ